MSDNNPAIKRRMTVPVLQAKKTRGEPIVTLTAYEYPIARILVEDSLGMVVLGYGK